MLSSISWSKVHDQICTIYNGKDIKLKSLQDAVNIVELGNQIYSIIFKSLKERNVSMKMRHLHQ